MTIPGDSIDFIRDEMYKLAARPDVQTVETTNSLNDRIAVALAYLGRASQKVIRNEREGCDAVENLVKAAAVIAYAIDVELAKP
jgi:hypothetical protein